MYQKMTPKLQQALNAVSESLDIHLSHFMAVPEDSRARLFEAMRYAAINSGKRIRPLLVTETAGLFNVSHDCSMRVAAAIECIHCYSLVHDDLPAMDNDDYRRGKPTTHKVFDEATAILVGDALLTLAFEILAHEDTHEAPLIRAELCLEVAQASGSAGMVGGQMMDIIAENELFDLATTTRLQQLKTGALISSSVRCGAILGKADPDQQMHLRGYAHDLGLAFQIADDILDHSGDAQTVGKATGKDAKANKSTFVSLMGLEGAQAHAKRLTDQAITHLTSFGAPAQILRDLAEFTITRDR